MIGERRLALGFRQRRIDSGVGRHLKANNATTAAQASGVILQRCRVRHRRLSLVA